MDQGNYQGKVISITRQHIAQMEPRNQDRVWRVRSKFSSFGLHNSDMNRGQPYIVPSVIGMAGKGKANSEDRADNRIRGDASKLRILAITSGKGGVGKTNVVANLGYVLSQMGSRVLVLDADLGLGNLDILLGITPKYNLSHVIAGEKSISDIAVKGPGRMRILPAASGIEEVTHLTNDQRNHLLHELQLFTDSIDVLLIDTAAGISPNVMCFNAAAQEIMVVVSPEPTSITDAYALMKVLSLRYGIRAFKLLVNLVSDSKEAYEVFRQLQVVSNRFLNITIDYLGYVLFDRNVARCVRRQKVVSDILPATGASQCFYALAREICKASPDPGNGTDGFWKSLLNNNSDESA